MNGWDFVERYQERTGGRVIPIVVVSAAGAVPRSLERRGVRHFLPKPFDVEQLARSVADALAAAGGSGSATPAVPAGDTVVGALHDGLVHGDSDTPADAAGQARVASPV
jgi:DNA-binding NtrC family response regulator